MKIKPKNKITLTNKKTGKTRTLTRRGTTSKPKKNTPNRRKEYYDKYGRYFS